VASWSRLLWAVLEDEAACAVRFDGDVNDVPATSATPPREVIATFLPFTSTVPVMVNVPRRVIGTYAVVL